MAKQNFSKIIILFLIIFFIGIVLGQFLPIKKLFSFLSIFSNPKPSTPIITSTPLPEKETEILCRNQGKKLIEVDLFNQKLKMCESGKAIKEMKISSGKPENPTPTGSFRVINKSLMVYSKSTKCWLPFWVGFTQDGKYGFHEVPICDNNNGRTGLDEIGQAVSFGCVRLNIRDAELLYNWVEINTPVYIF